MAALLEEKFDAGLFPFLDINSPSDRPQAMATGLHRRKMPLSQ
jgi:hypothetical protein